MEHPSIADETLREKIKEIEQILALYKEGKTIIEIAGSLDFAQSYVQDVLLCVQASAEEDPAAIAMLLEGEEIFYEYIKRGTSDTWLW